MSGYKDDEESGLETARPAMKDDDPEWQKYLKEQGLSDEPEGKAKKGALKKYMQQNNMPHPDPSPAPNARPPNVSNEPSPMSPQPTPTTQSIQEQAMRQQEMQQQMPPYMQQGMAPPTTAPQMQQVGYEPPGGGLPQFSKKSTEAIRRAMQNK